MTKKTKSSGKTEAKKGSTKKEKVAKKEPVKVIMKKKGEVMIKNLGKSTLVEEDLQHTESMLHKREIKEVEDEHETKLFYRNFVFKCAKCVSEFEHKTNIPIIEHKVVCPVCKEKHVVRIVPVTRHYELKMPKDLTAVKHAKKKK